MGIHAAVGGIQTWHTYHNTTTRDTHPPLMMHPSQQPSNRSSTRRTANTRSRRRTRSATPMLLASSNKRRIPKLKAVSQKRVAYRVSANFTDVTHDLPGLNPGAVVNGCAVRGRDGLAYIRIQVAGAKLYVPASTQDKKITFMQKIAGDRGSSVAKPSGPTTVAKNQTYRVIYRNGCAFRNSPQWADRNTKDTPAECGAIVSGNVIRGTDSVSYLNVAPGFFLPIATADGKILIMEVVGSGQSAPARPVAAPRAAPVVEPPRRETLSHHQAAGSMRDSEFARILQTEEETRAGVAPGSSSQVVQPVKAAPAAPAAAPPAQWNEIQDAQGRTYYWNKTTNETSWTPPGASAHSAALENDIKRISMSADCQVQKSTVNGVSSVSL